MLLNYCVQLLQTSDCLINLSQVSACLFLFLINIQSKCQCYCFVFNCILFSTYCLWHMQIVWLKNPNLWFFSNYFYITLMSVRTCEFSTVAINNMKVTWPIFSYYFFFLTLLHIMTYKWSTLTISLSKLHEHVMQISLITHTCFFLLLISTSI